MHLGFLYIVFDPPEIVDDWSLDGPGRPGNLSKRCGASPPPTFLKIFPTARGRPDPKNRRPRPVGQKPYIKKPISSDCLRKSLDFEIGVGPAGYSQCVLFVSTLPQNADSATPCKHESH